MLHQLVEAVVGGVGAARRGDDVEGHAAAGHEVERVEETRHIEWMHEGGRIGEPEADMLGDPRHGGDVGRHVLPRPLDAPARAGLFGAFPAGRDSGAVAEEDHVETAALADSCQVLEHGQVGIDPVPPRAGCAPPPIGVGKREIDPQVNLLRHQGLQSCGRFCGVTDRRAS